MLKTLLFLGALAAAPSMGATITYTVALSGLNESPVNASAGIGNGTVIFDTTANTMAINLTFSGLTGTTTASHIHAATAVPFTGTAGVATQTPTFAGFPLGVTSGSYTQTFDLTQVASFNAAYYSANGGTSAGATAALEAAAAAGTAYLNVHTTAFPGGEIRGFLTLQTPEPGTFGMFGCAMAAAALLRRKLRS